MIKISLRSNRLLDLYHTHLLCFNSVESSFFFVAEDDLSDIFTHNDGEMQQFIM